MSRRTAEEKLQELDEKYGVITCIVEGSTIPDQASAIRDLLEAITQPTSVICVAKVMDEEGTEGYVFSHRPLGNVKKYTKVWSKAGSPAG